MKRYYESNSKTTGISNDILVKTKYKFSLAIIFKKHFYYKRLLKELFSNSDSWFLNCILVTLMIGATANMDVRVVGG